MPQPAVTGRLAEQQSPAIAAHIHSWIRRDRDYLQVVIGTTARPHQQMVYARVTTHCP